MLQLLLSFTKSASFWRIQKLRHLHYFSQYFLRDFASPRLQKRVMVYPNGESCERAVTVWGEGLGALLEAATAKLGLWRNARALYTLDGSKVHTTHLVQRCHFFSVLYENYVLL